MDKEKKDENSYEFLKETIKEKPVNKKRLVKEFARLAASGALFGLAAAVVFSAAVSQTARKQQEDTRAELPLEEEAAQKGQETGDSKEEAQQDTAEKADTAEKDGGEEKEPAKVVMELTPEIYQKLYTDIFATANQAKKSMVTVIGSQNDENWFQTPYEEQISGLLAAESEQDYYVLTEYRIVENVDRIQVIFCDGTITDARFQKEDINTGLAVLKIPKSGISVSTREIIAAAPMGESYSVKQGEPVLAIGCPMGYSDSVGYGIVTSASNKVSRVDAEYGLLMTDIAGSSNGSGVILDLNGKVVGIISQGFAREDAGNQVTGLLISQVRELIQTLSDENKDIIYMGITGENITPEISEKKGIPVGIFVEKVEVDSPAMQVGIQNGDVITELNGEKVQTVTGYQQQLKACKAGETIKVKAMRQGTEGYIGVSFEVTLKVR